MIAALLGRLPETARCDRATGAGQAAGVGGGGLYWLLPGLVIGFTGAVYNAWILLIEILR